MLKLATLAAVSGLALLAASTSRAETVLIENAHIYSEGSAGEIAHGSILVRDGKIAAIGSEVKAPPGVKRLDAGGRIVTPGLIVTGASVGLDEIEQVSPTQDSGVEAGPLSAGLDLQYGLNPDSTVIPILRLTGATSAVAEPTLGREKAETHPQLFLGQAAGVSLDGQADMLIKPKIAMGLVGGEQGASLAGGSRAAFLVELKAQLDEARAYAKARNGFSDSQALGLTRADLEALIPVIEGREPLYVAVHRAADIRQMLKFAQDEHLKLILAGAEEGWRVAGEIAAANVPVVIDGDEDLPSSFEALGSTLENAARLQAAGVKISLHGPGLLTGGKTIRLAAGRAVAYGLPWGEALAAITINPARAFGLAGEVGSLEVGKSADIVVWDGDPLDTQGAPYAVLIKGERQALTSRQTALRDRYLKPDNGLPPQYRQ